LAFRWLTIQQNISATIYADGKRDVAVSIHSQGLSLGDLFNKISDDVWKFRRTAHHQFGRFVTNKFAIKMNANAAIFRGIAADKQEN
jgi:hypothetical protein